MLVSVIVPAYDEENYIRPCLESLAHQHRDGFDFEIILVDANSTDRTREIAQEYGVYIVLQEQRGIAEARELGFRAARGEIIASTDADSIPPKDWLVRLVAVFRQSPKIVGIYGPARLYDGKPHEDFFLYYLGGSYLWLNAAINKPVFSGQNFAVRREAWQAVGGFDCDWVSAEDVNLSLKLARVGKVKFDWDIRVYTSARRTREGYWALLSHSLSNYFRVTWLNMPPLPFKDIR